MSKQLTAEEILEQFEGVVDGGFHWKYDGPRKATFVGAKLEPDTFDGTRLEAVFALSVDDDEYPEAEVRYPIGNVDQYESLDGVSLSDSSHGIRKNSTYGKFGDAVLKLAKSEIIGRGKGPHDTTYLVGASFTIEAKELKFGKDKEGEPIVSVRPIPTEFFGFVDVDTPATAATTDDLDAKLKALATEAADANAFMVAALPIAPPEMAGDIASGKTYAELTA